MTPEEAKVRAERASQLLSDPLLSEAFSATEQALMDAVAVAKTPDESFKAAIAMQMHKLIKDCLSSHIETARIIEYNTKKSFVDRVLGR